MKILSLRLQKGSCFQHCSPERHGWWPRTRPVSLVGGRLAWGYNPAGLIEVNIFGAKYKRAMHKQFVAVHAKLVYMLSIYIYIYIFVTEPFLFWTGDPAIHARTWTSSAARHPNFLCLVKCSCVLGPKLFWHVPFHLIVNWWFVLHNMFLPQVPALIGGEKVNQ